MYTRWFAAPFDPKITRLPGDVAITGGHVTVLGYAITETVVLNPRVSAVVQDGLWFLFIDGEVQVILEWDPGILEGSWRLYLRQLLPGIEPEPTPEWQNTLSRVFARVVWWGCLVCFIFTAPYMLLTLPLLTKCTRRFALCRNGVLYGWQIPPCPYRPQSDSSSVGVMEGPDEI